MIWRKTAFILFFSTLIISGGSGLGLHLYRRFWPEPKFTPITKMALTGARYHKLPLAIVEQILNLSSDAPQNFHDFSACRAEKLLLANHFIKKAHVQKIKPDALFIEVDLREPVARLGNRSHTLVDADGRLFCEKPIYSPKNLPVVFVPENQCLDFGSCLQQASLVRQLLKRGPTCIDLAYSLDLSSGRRQITLLFEEREHAHLVRLCPENLASGLARYTILKEKMNGSAILDLRVEGVAYERRVDSDSLDLWKYR